MMENNTNKTMQNSRDHMETDFHPLRLGYENLVLIHMLNRKSFSVFQILKPLGWCRERQNILSTQPAKLV